MRLGLAAICVTALLGCTGGSAPDAQPADTSNDMAAADTITSCTATGCGRGQMCCEATGQCYDPSCLACCMAPVDANTMDAMDVVITGPPCHSTSDCLAGNVCVFPTMGCGTMGVCEANESCMFDPGMFCGCDGHTFAGVCAGAPQPWVSAGPCDGG